MEDVIYVDPTKGRKWWPGTFEKPRSNIPRRGVATLLFAAGSTFSRIPLRAGVRLAVYDPKTGEEIKAMLEPETR